MTSIKNSPTDLEDDTATASAYKLDKSAIARREAARSKLQARRAAAKGLTKAEDETLQKKSAANSKKEPVDNSMAEFEIAHKICELSKELAEVQEAIEHGANRHLITLEKVSKIYMDAQMYDVDLLLKKFKRLRSTKAMLAFVDKTIDAMLSISTEDKIFDNERLITDTIRHTAKESIAQGNLQNGAQRLAYILGLLKESSNLVPKLDEKEQKALKDRSRVLKASLTRTYKKARAGGYDYLVGLSMEEISEVVNTLADSLGVDLAELEAKKADKVAATALSRAQSEAEDNESDSNADDAKDADIDEADELSSDENEEEVSSKKTASKKKAAKATVKSAKRAASADNEDKDESLEAEVEAAPKKRTSKRTAKAEAQDELLLEDESDEETKVSAKRKATKTRATKAKEEDAHSLLDAIETDDFEDEDDEYIPVKEAARDYNYDEEMEEVLSSDEELMHHSSYDFDEEEDDDGVRPKDIYGSDKSVPSPSDIYKSPLEGKKRRTRSAERAEIDPSTIYGVPKAIERAKRATTTKTSAEDIYGAIAKPAPAKPSEVPSAADIYGVISSKPSYEEVEHDIDEIDDYDFDGDDEEYYNDDQDSEFIGDPTIEDIEDHPVHEVYGVPYNTYADRPMSQREIELSLSRQFVTQERARLKAERRAKSRVNQISALTERDRIRREREEHIRQLRAERAAREAKAASNRSDEELQIMAKREEKEAVLRAQRDAHAQALADEAARQARERRAARNERNGDDRPLNLPKLLKNQVTQAMELKANAAATGAETREISSFMAKAPSLQPPRYESFDPYQSSFSKNMDREDRMDRESRGERSRARAERLERPLRVERTRARAERPVRDVPKSRGVKDDSFNSPSLAHDTEVMRRFMSLFNNANDKSKSDDLPATSQITSGSNVVSHGQGYASSSDYTTDENSEFYSTKTTPKVTTSEVKVMVRRKRSYNSGDGTSSWSGDSMVSGMGYSDGSNLAMRPEPKPRTRRTMK